MANKKLSDLDFFQAGILVSFQGKENVKRESILDSSSDDDGKIREALGALWKAGIISYNKDNDSFTFPNYGLN